MPSLTKAILRIAITLAVNVAAVGVAQSHIHCCRLPCQDSDPLAGLKPGPSAAAGERCGLADAARTAENRSRTGSGDARIEADAKSLLNNPPLVYKKEGKRLLDVSRQAVQRILLWSVAYHLTGEHVYAEHAKQEMLNLAAFPDWNPSHFLDTAEMTTAFALGYDWLYDELDPQSRAMIRARHRGERTAARPRCHGGLQQLASFGKQLEPGVLRRTYARRACHRRRRARPRRAACSNWRARDCRRACVRMRPTGFIPKGRVTGDTARFIRR